MLATLEDLEQLLGSSVDASRAETLLAHASAAVRSYTGQHFTRETTTVTVRVPKSRWLRLAQRPVWTVDAVTDTNDNPLTFTFDGLDRVRIPANVPSEFSFEPWLSPVRTAKVTYDHGYDQTPGDIIAVVCQVAGRAYGVKADDTALNQETLGSYNYSTGNAAASGATGLLLPERQILDRYRGTARTIGVET